MADIYSPGFVPQEYDAAWMTEELQRLAASLAEFEVPLLRIVPLHVAPTKLFEGLIANADGTDWNPGGGGGLYQYLSGAWVKL